MIQARAALGVVRATLELEGAGARMLVLSRKSGEAIVLAGNITIQVLGIEHDRVKIGVDAPPDVLVLRAELVPGYEPPAAVLAERPAHAHAHNYRTDSLGPHHLRPVRPLPREE